MNIKYFVKDNEVFVFDENESVSVKENNAEIDSILARENAIEDLQASKNMDQKLIEHNNEKILSLNKTYKNANKISYLAGLVAAAITLSFSFTTIPFGIGCGLFVYAYSRGAIYLLGYNKKNMKKIAKENLVLSDNIKCYDKEMAKQRAIIKSYRASEQNIEINDKQEDLKITQVQDEIKYLQSAKKQLERIQDTVYANKEAESYVNKLSSRSRL